MKITEHIARQFKEVYFGKNWTWSNLKETLEGVTVKQATTQIYGLNTIATLVYHLNYYVNGVSDFLENGKLEIHDKYAFAQPPISSQEEWDAMVNQVFLDGERFIGLIEKLPDSLLGEIFLEEKYTTYYRNVAGIIEHVHYHLGQIVVIKKILNQQAR